MTGDIERWADDGGSAESPAEAWAWSCAEAYSAALSAERLRADKLAAAIQAFMRGDGDFADQMATALDEWDEARYPRRRDQ